MFLSQGYTRRAVLSSKTHHMWLHAVSLLEFTYNNTDRRLLRTTVVQQCRIVHVLRERCLVSRCTYLARIRVYGTKLAA